MPLVPYPARSTRHLPLEGKAVSVVIPFPHMRISALTMREKPHSRIVAFPIGEGGPRSGALVLVYRLLEMISLALFHPSSPIQPPPLRGTFPSRGRWTALAALGCSYIACLRRSPALFHTASTLSGSLRSPPSPHGEGFMSGTAALSQMPCFHSVQTKTALRGRALQSGFWFYYSTVTDFARFLGLSTSFPLLIEV